MKKSQHGKQSRPACVGEGLGEAGGGGGGGAGAERREGDLVGSHDPATGRGALREGGFTTPPLRSDAHDNDSTAPIDEGTDRGAVKVNSIHPLHPFHV